MNIQELIDKLDRLGKDKKVSVASNENMDTIFEEVCIEQLNNKIVLFGLEGSEEF